MPEASFLAPLLAKIQDPAVIVLLLVSGGLGWLHVVWRREERQDRKEMLATFNLLVTALNEVKVAIAGMGK